MTDVFFYNGEISRGDDLRFIECVSENKASDTCLLVLVTPGGDPDAAYKICRYIQNEYDSFKVLISGLCKSAGTLLAAGADELIFMPYGELGPLDVQLAKQDSIVGMQSGLNTSEAFRALDQRALTTYHRLVTEIIGGSGGIVSYPTACHSASELISSLYGQIFARIDPEEVGSRSRAMRIGEDYGNRLNGKWRNMKLGTIQQLASFYPSHGFVIDYMEAKVLFHRVRKADGSEAAIVQDLEVKARFPGPSLEFGYVMTMDAGEDDGDGDDEDPSAENDDERRPLRAVDAHDGDTAQASGAGHSEAS